METKEIILYIVIPIGVTIISSLILAFFKWVKPLIIKDKLAIKELNKSTDPDTESFISLYNRRIDESLRICAEQIVEFIDPDTSDDVEHHLYVSKHLGSVVGFIKVIISKLHNYLFIAYIAIDNEDQIAVKLGASTLLKKVIKKHIRGRNGVAQIFIEIERGANNGYYTPFYKHISRLCKSQKLVSYLINFDYIQPLMPDDKYNMSNEEILSLIWIPKKQSKKTYFTKTEVITICKNVYEDIYLPSCKQSNCSENYKTYLNSLYLKYKSSLPNKIKIISMTGDAQ